MKEIKGDLWDYYMNQDYVICITTNGFTKKNGEAVCGRGSAFEATQRIQGFARMLGEYIRKYGNMPGIMRTEPDEWGVVIFPVKHNWWEKGDKNLILAGAHWLFDQAMANPDITYVMGRPGCGNGRLEWDGEEGVRNLISFLPDNVHIITKVIRGVV
jgi:hypothetical protein